MNIPVYLVTGFFLAGKTRWIRRMLREDDTIERPVLYLQCEDGDEKFTDEELEEQQVCRIRLRKQEEFRYDEIESLQRDLGCRSVLIELNGFWPCGLIYRDMPEGWKVRDKYFLLDAGTMNSYGTNLRSQMEDKIAWSSYVLVNRMKETDDRGRFLETFRGSTRRARIFFSEDGDRYEEDTEVIDTPYEFTDQLTVINDNIYAYWCHDMARRPELYEDRRWCIRAQLHRDEAGRILAGRNVTTARIQDAEFRGLLVTGAESERIDDGTWYLISGTVRRGETGRYLSAERIEETYAPMREIAFLP